MGRDDEKAAPADETCLPGHVSDGDTTAHHPVTRSRGAVGSPHLILFSADWTRVRAISLTRPLTIGRSSESDVTLDGDRSASRLQARIIPAGDAIRIEDLGSRNGTFVDGTRILRARARDGSLLRLGDTLMRIAWLTEPFVAATPEGPFVGGRSAVGLRRIVSLLGPTPLPVSILGETGTGKDVVARMLHAASGLRGPLIAVNCAALPPSLVESELFGHVRGAFTGAAQARKGLFAAAAGGTLFLDEIGELPLPAQATLLRVLEDGMVRPVGSEAARKVDVRIVSATNRDLRRAVAERTFRADLHARVAAMELTTPPLRERPEDLPALVAYLRARSGQPPLRLGADALEAMALHEWPQNLRELDNLCRQLALRLPTTGSVMPVELEELPARIRAARDLARAARSRCEAPRPDGPRAELEHALLVHAGNVRQASAALGLARSHVYRLLKRWNIVPARFRPASGGTCIADGEDPQ